VIQRADPPTIYARPATRTVAAFFGTPNLLPAKAREVRREGGGALARVEGEGWEGWCAAPIDLQPGDAVTVVVRPEIVRLAGDRPRSGIVWTGVVRQRIFRGARTLYTVESGALSLMVDAPPDQVVATDREVTATAEAAHTWAVTE
jgi:iron(III) transport system ATP-binding protein